MNPAWLRPLLLVCVFGAVVLAVEVLVQWLASSRAEGKAINLRLKMIGRGRSQSETLNLLRRSDGALPTGLPPILYRAAQKFERMLMQAQLTVATSRLMLIIFVAPVAIFFVMLVMMTFSGIGISFGRVLISATFSGLLGGALPVMIINFKATRMRKKMQ